MKDEPHYNTVKLKKNIVPIPVIIDRGLSLFTYAPRGRGGGGQLSYTCLLRIACKIKKKGGGGSDSLACTIS